MKRFSVLVFANKQKGKETAPLRLRVRWDGKIVSVNVGRSVVLSKWNAEAQRCKPNSSHRGIPASVINAELENITATVSELMTSYARKNLSPSVELLSETLKNLRDGNDKTEDEFRVSNLAERYFDTQSHNRQWTDSTIATTQYALRLFIECFPLLDVRTIGKRTIDDFASFLIGKGVSNSSCKVLVVRVKTFLRWCVVEGCVSLGDWYYYTPRIKLASNDIVFLSLEELRRIEMLEGLTPNLQRYRDVFVFCAYTSLRFSDVVKLRKTDCHDDYVSVVTQKTSESLRIDLNVHALRILNRYKDIFLPKDMALPVPTVKTYNDAIREIARLAGIDEPVRRVAYYGGERRETIAPKWQFLSSHSARRTFISNALALGIPADVVRKFSGHKSYKSMLPYIGVTDKTKADAIRLFDTDISDKKGTNGI